MESEKQANYRKVLEQHLSTLGRDDIGIGTVTQADDHTLCVEFIKGPMRHEATIPVASLQHPDQARAALNAALLKISKAVEKQHIEAAQTRE